ncbi:iron-sulfur cluster carrier protein ApbC [Allohahella marinimesophila]
MPETSANDDLNTSLHGLPPELQTALASLVDPVLNESYLSLDALQIDTIEPLALTVRPGYPMNSKLAALSLGLRSRMDIAGFPGTAIRLEPDVVPAPSPAQSGHLAGVRNIVMVASGKGGVGKSTTAVNLALALQAEGASVGMLDADIYGPSQRTMLGVAEDVQPELVDGKFLKPIVRFGVRSMSVGYLSAEKTPMVWRGPMATRALQQLLEQTIWGDLDYLIIDMPPGTGDIQISLAQRLKVSGALIVTTPQEVALIDARKGIEMFAKVGIPVLGLVENMATHICTNCGHEDDIFGQGGASKLAAEYDLPVLGSLPLDKSIREGADAGLPSVVADPMGPMAQAYFRLAHATGGQLWKQNLRSGEPAEILLTES